MSTSFDPNALQRATVYDQNGEKVGKIGQVYLDDHTEEPSFATVNTGLFGTKETFVPLTGARLQGDDVQVPYTKDMIKDAPRVDGDNHLDERDQDDLHSYYGLGGAGQQGAAGGHYDDGRGRDERDVRDGGRYDDGRGRDDRGLRDERDLREGDRYDDGRYEDGRGRDDRGHGLGAAAGGAAAGGAAGAAMGHHDRRDERDLRDGDRHDDGRGRDDRGLRDERDLRDGDRREGDGFDDRERLREGDLRDGDGRVHMRDERAGYDERERQAPPAGGVPAAGAPAGGGGRGPRLRRHVVREEQTITVPVERVEYQVVDDDGNVLQDQQGQVDPRDAGGRTDVRDDRGVDPRADGRRVDDRGVDPQDDRDLRR